MRTPDRIFEQLFRLKNEVQAFVAGAIIVELTPGQRNFLGADPARKIIDLIEAERKRARADLAGGK